MKEGREIEARKKREKERNARVAQLVERDLAKVEAAGSSPVSRSFYLSLKILGFGKSIFSGTFCDA